MNLYLMRHANAGLRRDNPTLDAKRALIKEGKEQCMLMARVLSAFKVQIDVIVSSPLKRALQTAQFVGTELGYDGKVEISPALGLNADYAAFSRCWPNMPTAKACWWWAITPTSSSFWAA
jgi:phosphohistidine phosphatase